MTGDIPLNFQRYFVTYLDFVSTTYCQATLLLSIWVPLHAFRSLAKPTALILSRVVKIDQLPIIPPPPKKKSPMNSI